MSDDEPTNGAGEPQPDQAESDIRAGTPAGPGNRDAHVTGPQVVPGDTPIEKSRADTEPQPAAEHPDTARLRKLRDGLLQLVGRAFDHSDDTVWIGELETLADRVMRLLDMDDPDQLTLAIEAANGAEHPDTARLDRLTDLARRGTGHAYLLIRPDRVAYWPGGDDGIVYADNARDAIDAAREAG